MEGQGKKTMWLQSKKKKYYLSFSEKILTPLLRTPTFLSNGKPMMKRVVWRPPFSGLPINTPFHDVMVFISMVVIEQSC